jgi:hypothetical protein
VTQFKEEQLADARGWAADVRDEATEHLRRLRDGETTFLFEDSQLLGQLETIRAQAAKFAQARR